MIHPTEATRSALGHPRWKQNVFVGLVLCAVGIVLLMTVALVIYGAIVIGIGIVWTVAAAMIGSSQERRDGRVGGDGRSV